MQTSIKSILPHFGKKKEKQKIYRFPAFNGKWYLRQIIGIALLFCSWNLYLSSVAFATGPVLEGSCHQLDTFSEGVRLFNNRQYVLSTPPANFEGMKFLRSSMGELQELTCVKSGTLYALTVAQGRRLQRVDGFEKVPQEGFQLYKSGTAENRVSIYKKEVKKGEKFLFEKWVLVLGENLDYRDYPTEPLQPWNENEGELLYNGIRLPKQWPPHHQDPRSREPMPVPYLESPPKVIPIDIGRQLFVDDFLIQSTTLQREFHQPEKYEGNPVLKPETEMELNQGVAPTACLFNDGVFYDPKDQLFKIWYHAGMGDGTGYAISRDGFKWIRPKLDVEPGTNRVIAVRKDDFRRDGVSVWLDQETSNSDERFKMFLYARCRTGTYPTGGRIFTSPDGIHFTERTLTGHLGDNSTIFYNPFRKKWVFSIRTLRNLRQRDYWENDDLLATNQTWKPEPVYWCGGEDLDKPDPQIKRPTQLYNVDAVAYESLMLGLFQIHYGPPNAICYKGKHPKLTELKVGFSRDGFHWDRTNRDTFITASKISGDWERGYIHSAGGCCLIVGDYLYFYYTGFSGNSPRDGGGVYAGGSTGLALLRRDGFASMNAGHNPKTLTTRPVKFSGKHFFVNLDASQGDFRVEVLNEAGKPIEPFTLENCVPTSGDKTLLPVRWKGAADLSAIAGKPVRFRFHLTDGKLYAFWVSPNRHGASHGYIAAGGPGFTGPTDTVGDQNTQFVK